MMADPSIRITVARRDGEVTRLVGNSGMATCMGPMNERIELSDPPTVSLRCSDPAELAWNLAALMGAVRSVSPEAFAMATVLMDLCNFEKPQARRILPDLTGGAA